MQVIGHRGARAVEPENTMRALSEGIRCADAVEVDLRRTRDGELIVIHDATLDRTTNGHGPVSAYSFDELQGLDAGMGERIPAFREVLERVNGRCGLFVEIKEPGTEDQACAMIRDAAVPRVTVVSFHKAVVERVAGNSDIRAGLIISGTGTDPAAGARAARADLLLPRSDLVTPDLVMRVHQAGLDLVAWTVNRDVDIRRMLGAGVDGIATDDPGYALGIIRRTGKVP